MIESDWWSIYVWDKNTGRADDDEFQERVRKVLEDAGIEFEDV